MRHLLKLTVLLCLCFNAYSQPNHQVLNRHVILIGIDGARRDAFNKAYETLKSQHLAPHFTSLINDGAIDNSIYAGGPKSDTTIQATLSEPGWVSILTGAWAKHHHIRFNSNLKHNHYNHHYPTIYNYIKHFNPMATTASYTDWPAMQLLADFKFYGNDSADVNEFYPSSSSTAKQVREQMTTDIANAIKQQNPPTFIFVHFDQPDGAGHKGGFSPDSKLYVDAIKREMFNIDKIAAAVEDSEKNGNQWLVIVTTDHGGHRSIHGTQHPGDRDIFAVFHAKDTAFSGGVTLTLQRGQTMFVPQVLDYLHMPHDMDTLDGQDLL